MYQAIVEYGAKFRDSFHNSGTLIFARLQVLVGAVWLVLTATDLSPFFAGNPKYLTAWLLFSGVITEMTRRRGTRTDDDNHLVRKD